jgi:hypothetical protein
MISQRPEKNTKRTARKVNNARRAPNTTVSAVLSRELNRLSLIHSPSDSGPRTACSSATDLGSCVAVSVAPCVITCPDAGYG